MYKDDLAALRARLTTVEAELAAEKQHCAAAVAQKHKRAVLLARQTLKEAPGHQKAIQILGAAACYLRDRGDAQWAYDRVKPGYRPLLRNICLRNDIVLKN